MDSKEHITADTKLQGLLKAHPWLKDELEEIHPAFSMLKTGIARIMIPIATIKMMSERSEMEVDQLIAAIQERIARHA